MLVDECFLKALRKSVSLLQNGLWGAHKDPERTHGAYRAETKTSKRKRWSSKHLHYQGNKGAKYMVAKGKIKILSWYSCPWNIHHSCSTPSMIYLNNVHKVIILACPWGLALVACLVWGWGSFQFGLSENQKRVITLCIVLKGSNCNHSLAIGPCLPRLASYYKCLPCLLFFLSEHLFSRNV